MRVAVVQTDPLFGSLEENLASALRQMRDVPADVYVLPELFASGYTFSSSDEVASLAEPFPSGKTRIALQAFAEGKRSFVVYGFPERDGSRIYNSAGIVGYDGTAGVYRKVHLFDGEKALFSAGDRPFPVFSTPWGKVGIMICFDWFFPESARTLALRGAQLIAHPSNLVLPHCPDAMRTRCLENRVFAATANRVGTETRGGRSFTFIGHSQITAPSGEILYRAQANGAAVGCCEVALEIADDKRINPNNDLLSDRRPQFYE